MSDYNTQVMGYSIASINIQKNKKLKQTIITIL